VAFETILSVTPRGPSTDQVTPARDFTVAPGTFTTLNFRMPMADADVFDTRNHVVYTFQKCDPGLDRSVEANWTNLIGPDNWDGGPDNLDRQGNPAPPNGSGGLSNPTNATTVYGIRIKYTITRRVPIGLDIEILESVTARIAP
jgi:hypothetical protein